MLLDTSSHILVSEINPWMSLYAPSHDETANALMSYSLFHGHCYIDICDNSTATICIEPNFAEGLCLSDTEPT